MNSCFAGEHTVLGTTDAKKGQKGISLDGRQGKLGFTIKVKVPLDLILNKCFFISKMRINPAVCYLISACSPHNESIFLFVHAVMRRDMKISKQSQYTDVNLFLP